MTLTLCVLAALALFLLVVAGSREVIGRSPLRVDWGLHALAVLAILVALSTPGIWYHADLYLGDIWTAQDALQKIAQGHRSSLDYFNPIGPVWEWLFALTLMVQPPSASSLVLTNVVVASLSLVLTVLLLRRRASAITVAIVGVIAVTTALSARDIDSLVTAAQSSMLAPYNRWGWALLLPVAMRAALPGTGRSITFGTVLTGFAIAVLLLLKITYGLAAIGIFIVVVVLYPARWREIGVVAVSTAISLVLLDWLSGGQVRAYSADIALSAQMSANGVRFPKFLSLLPTFAAYAVGCLLLVSLAVRRDREARTQAWWANGRVLILALAVGGSGLVVLMQNHYWTEAVTLLLMPLIVAERTGLFANVDGQPLGIWTRNAEWIGAIALVTLAMPAVDTGFILAQKVQTERKMSLAAPFAGTAFEGLVIDERYQPSNQSPCIERTCFDVRRMFDGADLIRQYCPAYRSAAVLAFNFSNPFPALLGSRSPRHGPIWLHVDRSFSRAVHTPGGKLFSDVGCIIIAKNDAIPAALREIYASDLQQTFRPVAENDHWELLARRSAPR